MKRDYVTNKLLLVFTLAFALLLLFTNIGRMMKSTTTFMLAWNITKILAVASIALFVAGIVMIFVEKAKKINVSCKLLAGKNIAVASFIIAACSTSLSLIFSSTMLLILYVLIPAIVVLYIVFYSYPKDFFMIVLSSILAGAGIWLIMSDVVISADIFVLAISAALIVLLAVFTVWAQIAGCKIKLFGKGFSPFKPDTKYTLVYLTYVLSLLLLAAAFLAADIAIYFIFGLVAYILITGVYYTIKLI